ncbi:MAG: hypothetical protein VZQ80_10075 [Lachnospiraceae bacterium]|nr:hypothetical protein [Lachnospiraceae bacterium]
MKKYIAEFIVTLVVLAAAVGLGAYVVKVTIDNGGSLFGPVADNSDGSTDSTTPASRVIENIRLSRSANETDTTGFSEPTGTVFIGDSRTVGMDGVVDIEGTNNQFVVAKVGEGLAWFKKSGLSSVEELRKENSVLTHWRLICLLGVNDLWDLDAYLEEFDTLREDSEVELILVSVNPVDGHPSISNTKIETFNAGLQDYAEENSLQYIDTYDFLMDAGYETQDGLHYKDATYQEIYDQIESAIDTDSQ